MMTNKDYTIVLDSGHGGNDVGAVDVEGDDDIYEDKIYTEESDLVLDFTLELAKRLKRRDRYNVVLTRGCDEYVKLSDRTKIANHNHADIFVSIHANSFSNSDAEGTETLYYPKSKEGKKLATETQRQLISSTKAVNRGIKDRDNLYVLEHTNMPAILIELGFISNPQEEERLHDNKYRRKQIHAIVKSILNYLG